jgi:hypothetical protein
MAPSKVGLRNGNQSEDDNLALVFDHLMQADRQIETASLPIPQWLPSAPAQ